MIVREGTSLILYHLPYFMSYPEFISIGFAYLFQRKTGD
jgi:hypothetical protein